MNKLILIALMLPWMNNISGQPSLTTSGNTTIPVVHNLSYDVSSKTYYKVQEGVSWKDINPIDLVGLYPKESYQQVHLDVDNNGNPLRINKIYSQKDMMPKWYVHKEYTNYGSGGILSKINADLSSPEDSYEPYDSSEQQLMLDFRQDILEKGYLEGFIYQPPSGDTWQTILAIADQVTISDDALVTTLLIDSRSETWDNKNLKKISQSPMEDGGIIRVTHYYLKDDKSGLNLLQAVIVERFMNLLNGICVTEVNIDRYSNYQMEAIRQEMDAGLRDNSVDSTPKFSLFPNPLRGDMLNLVLTPELIKEPLVVRITDITGRSLQAANLSFSSAKETIRISGDQYTDGLYFLVIESSNSVTTQPFLISK